MRASEIKDVDVITDARSVRCLVIRPVNLHVPFLAERHFQDVRDEMSLDAVVFAKTVGGAGGVEVAQRNKPKIMNLAVPMQDLLESQFGFAVRIDGPLRQVLVNRDSFRRTKNRAGGREDEALRARSKHGIEKVQAVGDVVPKVLRRIYHRLTDERVGCEVHDRVRFEAAQSFFQFFDVGEIALYK